MIVDRLNCHDKNTKFFFVDKTVRENEIDKLSFDIIDKLGIENSQGTLLFCCLNYLLKFLIKKFCSADQIQRLIKQNK